MNTLTSVVNCILLLLLLLLLLLQILPVNGNIFLLRMTNRQVHRSMTYRCVIKLWYLHTLFIVC